MSKYNFAQDLFDTYQSLSDGMKFAWLAIPAVVVISLAALVTRYRLAQKRLRDGIPGELICSIYRDEQNRLHMRHHKGSLEQPLGIYLLEKSAVDTLQQHDEAWHIQTPLITDDDDPDNAA